jgi:hypothetical protein
MGASSSPIADADNASAVDAGRPKFATSLRRALMNAIACVILYGNAAMALQPPSLQGKRWSLPIPAAARDAFLLNGMFSSYSLRNLDFFVFGLRTDTGAIEDRRRWVKLRLRDHFGQRHGVTFTQFFVAHHWDMHGARAQRDGWALLAHKIRERHNRLHPDRTISRVRLGTEDWPQSAEGFRARKQPRWMRPHTLFVEPEAR